MDIAPLMLELYGRIPPLAHAATEGLDASELVARPAPDANSIAWLIWHLTRVQDHHVAELMGVDQLWVTSGFAASFGLSPDPNNTGYGHSSADVATISPTTAHVLLDYLDAVNDRVRQFVASLGAADLDRIVDRRWDPPVSMGVRLVSIADDSLQHVGQANYVKGLLASR